MYSSCTRICTDKKQHVRVWYQHLTKELIEGLGFAHYAVENLIFYTGQTMYTLYIDDYILAGHGQGGINHITDDLNRYKLVLTIEGDLKGLLGVNIKRKFYRTTRLAESHLIYQIVTALHLSQKKDEELGHTIHIVKVMGITIGSQSA